MPLPPFAVRIAESQLGVLARRQLLAGMLEHQADALLRGPWFEPLELGVHRVVGGARLPAQRAIAAALRGRAGAVLTGPVVLALYGVDGFAGDEPFVVLTPPGRRLKGVDFRQRTDPDPDRPVSVRGAVRLVGPVDALIDSAEFVEELGARRLRLAHDVLRWRGQLQRGVLGDRIRTLGPRSPGASALVELLELDERRSTGEGERALGRLLSRFHPAPEPEVWVTPHRRVDWYFRSLRFGYEYQGSVDHATLAGRIADAARDVELRREGIRIGYLSAGDLADEGSLLATVAGALAARAHELGVAAPALRGT
jgi:hypothetical protein